MVDYNALVIGICVASLISFWLGRCFEWLVSEAPGGLVVVIFHLACIIGFLASYINLIGLAHPDHPNRVHVWEPNETLTAADLNKEFDNILAHIKENK